MSLCMKEMTPMPDARRPLRNQERKAGGRGGPASVQSLPSSSPGPDSHTEGLLRTLPPHLAPNSHLALAAPTKPYPQSPLSSPSEHLSPKLCTSEHSRQSAEFGGESKTEIAEPKSEDRGQEVILVNAPPRGASPRADCSLLSQTCGTHCPRPSISLASPFSFPQTPLSAIANVLP